MFLMIDNYDSFVYNLVRYIRELDQDVLVVRNDKISLQDVARLNPAGVILSPGPKHPRDGGVCPAIIQTYKGRIPVLGICLGHQSIAYAFGGKICKGPQPMHGKVTPIRHDGKGVFSRLPNPLSVTRYHSLVVERDGLPDQLEVTAWDGDGIIMGIRHKIYPIEGVQFHPEAELTESGHRLLSNFIGMCGQGDHHGH